MLIIPYLLAFLMLCSMYRLLKGPTFYDKLMSISLISVHIILIMCTVAVIYDKSFYLDIAIVYALLSFSEIVAFLKLFPQG